MPEADEKFSEKEALTWAIWAVNSMMDITASSWEDIQKFDNGAGEKTLEKLAALREKF